MAKSGNVDLNQSFNIWRKALNLPDNILQNVEVKRKADVVDELCKEFDEEVLHKIWGELIDIAKGIYDVDVGHDCDLQLVQRRKEKEKAYS